MGFKIDSYDALQIGDLAGVNTISYSGRGMYGKRCLAYTTDDYSDTQFSPMMLGVEAVGIIGYEDAARMARNMRTDSMGLGQVIYFPSIEYDEDEDEDDG